MAILFKSLRYRSSGPQTWGINLRRLVKWKNEFSTLAGAGRARHRRRQPDGLGRHARRLETGGLEEHRAQALRRGIGHHQSRRPICHDNHLDANAGLDVSYGSRAA